MLEKQQLRKNFQKKNQIITSSEVTKNQLLEYDLIRLCFSKDQTIRKYLFEHIKPEWLVKESSKIIYDKVYIHLHSESSPEVNLIMSELKEREHRNELAKLVFDLEKLTPTLNSARECVARLEQAQINSHIQSIREELKNVESSGLDPTPLMQKIEELQARKKNIL